MLHCYQSPEMDALSLQRDLHIFADSSERPHGSVGYLHAESQDGHLEVSLLAAISRVAPKRQQSMLRLEVTAATGPTTVKTADCDHPRCPLLGRLHNSPHMAPHYSQTPVDIKYLSENR